MKHDVIFDTQSCCSGQRVNKEQPANFHVLLKVMRRMCMSLLLKARGLAPWLKPVVSLLTDVDVWCDGSVTAASPLCSPAVAPHFQPCISSLSSQLSLLQPHCRMWLHQPAGHPQTHPPINTGESLSFKTWVD